MSDVKHESSSSIGRTGTDNSNIRKSLIKDGKPLTGIDLKNQYDKLLESNKKRFTIKIDDTTRITMHIDPTQLRIKKSKRIRKIDTLAGAIFQDFGFDPMSIEIDGTTGSWYKEAIDYIDTVFRNNNPGNNNVDIYVDGKEYKAVWNTFSYTRDANTHIYKYHVEFQILTENIIKDESNSKKGSYIDSGFLAVIPSGLDSKSFIETSSSVSFTNDQIPPIVSGRRESRDNVFISGVDINDVRNINKFSEQIGRVSYNSKQINSDFINDTVLWKLNMMIGLNLFDKYRGV